MVNIFSSLLIAAIYGFIIFQRHSQGIFDLTEDFRKWGVILIIYIGISIVARIIIYIIFHILNAIATREKDIPVRDERDKFIDLKSTRNGCRAFSFVFLFSIVLLAFGMPVYGLILFFIVAGLAAEITENISQIYFYRKGI